MDMNVLGIIRYTCFDNDYEKQCKHIFQNHIHHESTDKIQRFQNKRNRSDLIKNSSNFPILPDKNNNIKQVQILDKFSYIFIYKDILYLLKNDTYLYFNINNIPKNLKSFLLSDNNHLVAYNTVEIYSAFSTYGIKVNCYYDIQLYLLANGTVSLSMKEFMKQNKLSPKNPKQLLLHLQKTFLNIKKNTPESEQNILNSLLLPYNRIMCKIAYKPPKIDSMELKRAIELKQINEKVINKYIGTEDRFYISDISKTITYRYCTRNKNFQGLSVKKDSNILSATKYIIPENKNMLYIDIDLSYADIVSVAALSKDNKLNKLIKNNEDVYLHVRDIILSELIKNGISDMDITRKTAKQIFISYINGQCAKNMCSNIIESCKLSSADSDNLAKNIQKRIKTEFDGIEHYRKFLIGSARKNKYIRTINGLKTPILDDNNVFTTAINRMNQSTTSFTVMDLTLRIFKEAKTNHVPMRLIMQRHDELIFEVPKSYSKELMKIISKESNYSPITELPIPHELLVGKNYYEIIQEKSKSDMINKLMETLERRLINLAKKTNCTSAEYEIDSKYEQDYKDFLIKNGITIDSIIPKQNGKIILKLSW